MLAVDRGAEAAIDYLLGEGVDPNKQDKVCRIHDVYSNSNQQ
jgi:hypothetical protein